jgi:gas vesicle protein
MKLLVSTLVLALGGGAALLPAAPLEPCDPPLAPATSQGPADPLATAPQAPQPTSGTDLLLLAQDPDEEVQRELEQARRELEQALQQAQRERAGLERELARELERVQQEVRRAQSQGEREAQRALQEAQREAERAMQEGRRAAEEARREASLVREEALREAQRARERALEEAERARADALRQADQVRRSVRLPRPGRGVQSATASERERRLEERIAVLERLLEARSAPKAGRETRQFFGLGSVPAPAPPAHPAHPAVPASPAHPAHPVAPAPPSPHGATSGAHHAPAAAPHGCCCCCCSHHHGASAGSCSHDADESCAGESGEGEVSFYFATPDASWGEVAFGQLELGDAAWDAEESWTVTWPEAADDFEEQMAELAQQLAEADFTWQAADGEHVFFEDLAVRPGRADLLIEIGEDCCDESSDGCADCADEDCESAECELDVWVIECEPDECEEVEIELLEELEELEPLTPERLHAPTPGVPQAPPSVALLQDGAWRPVPSDALFVPAVAPSPLADGPDQLSGELAELVEEMRSEIQSLRAVLRALREEVRSGGLDEQL